LDNNEVLKFHRSDSFVPLWTNSGIFTNYICRSYHNPDKSILFLRRNNDPVKGQWWFPGGRVRKGETLVEALNREVKEETGLEVIESELVNGYSRIFDTRHDISIAYLCDCKGEKIKLNNEHSEYKYFKKLPTNIHPYLIQVMTDLEKITNNNFKTEKPTTNEKTLSNSQ